MLTYDELLKENHFLKEEVLLLREEVLLLRAQVKELLEKLNTNSNNSSKPPSQDSNRQKRTNKPTGKTRGGQIGHKGHGRQLISEEEVNQIIDVKPHSCPNGCSVGFDAQSIFIEVRQVFELPEIAIEVTQYNIHTCKCNFCGKTVKAEVPAEAKFGFGPRAMGFITLLSGECKMSKRCVALLMGRLGMRICTGAVCKIHARAVFILKAAWGEIKEFTLKEAHLNGDESSWNSMGKKKWIWAAIGQRSAFFQIDPSRSGQAFHRVFGSYQGAMTTDRYSAYNIHQGERQVCWSHLKRDFEKVAEREGKDSFIGKQLIEKTKQLFTIWHAFKAKDFDREELKVRMKSGVQEDVKILLQYGAINDALNSKTKSLCWDLLNRFASLWLFTEKEGIEPTNNAAERAIRSAVIWRRLSLGTKSQTGEHFVERMLTVVETLNRQAKNVFGYLVDCFKALIHMHHPPPVLVG